ncbi:MAG: hypothetical protein B7Y12_02010 [Rhizobiales bacterium 24-66-13]|jgi:hypothetical protein|nr:MAG: hypothetical protein B7Z41_03865 [Rhizobiales bacterium 12-66-7]OYY88796.1 MAG: hypothetical protein B7Y61_01040 [Rhizobiales bacterium 35-66-30]OYZ82791.1 MAG: hypothetical protein B7Y12_02010 [Rhizobiales bacterium 24-66-13]OZB11823.1 MAG: hypothetical protein B7X67_01990 [Rhizobiales bacterium 39-66-18]HQS09505.1 hypothetical protein [Xanthobacteraceae bacterium]
MTPNHATSCWLGKLADALRTARDRGEGLTDEQIILFVDLLGKARNAVIVLEFAMAERDDLLAIAADLDPIAPVHLTEMRCAVRPGRPRLTLISNDNGGGHDTR